MVLKRSELPRIGPRLLTLATLDCLGGSAVMSMIAASDDNMVHPPRTRSDTNCHGLSIFARKAHAAPTFLLEDE